MRNKSSVSSSGSQRAEQQDLVGNIRSQPPHIYDNITTRLLQFGLTMGITAFVGLIVRYAVQEFDPSVSTISVTTSRVNDSDVASLSVSKHFLERVLEFVEESIAIVASVIPIGFPLCTLFNRYFAKVRAKRDKISIRNDKVLAMIPKYVVIGDIQACQLPNSERLRPLVRDTIYQLIKAHLKPKLIVEESYEDARKLGIRIGLLRRHHHRLAIIKSVDLLRTITDSRGDIKQGKVRYLLSRMKIMSQSTPADKSLLVYLMKHCETLPNENLAYLGYSFTDPEAMKVADCALTFQDCDDEDVKKSAQVLLQSPSMTFTDLYLFVVICLLSSNITQSYALYQEQLLSYSQYSLIIMIQQVFAILALMTKWLASLAQAPARAPVAAQMSHAATEDMLVSAISGPTATAETIASPHRKHRSRHRSPPSAGGNGESSPGNSNIRLQRLGGRRGSTSSLESSGAGSAGSAANSDDDIAERHGNSSSVDVGRRKSRSRDLDTSRSRSQSSSSMGAARSRRHGSRAHAAGASHIHLSGLDLDQAVINSQLVVSYKQTFHNSSLVDDVTYRLAKLHIAYQVLVMIIIMIFGNAMFQLNTTNNRQHQTLALNSLIMNNIFNLANCFNQAGDFNLGAGFKNHPFFVCALLLAIFVQWFVCFVFALLSALIAPLTGQQQRQRVQRYQQEQNERQMRARTRLQPRQQQQQPPPHRSQTKSPSTPKAARLGAAGRQHNPSGAQGRKSQISLAADG